MSKTLEELEGEIRAAYADAARSQRELALLESETWPLALDRMRSGERPRMRKRAYFMTMGEAGRDSEIRITMHNAGARAESAWRAVDAGEMSLGQAYAACATPRVKNKSKHKNFPDWAQKPLDDLCGEAAARLAIELPGLEEWEARGLVGELYSDARASVQAFLAKVRVRRKRRADAELPNLEIACEWLELPLPKNGQPLDYAAARKQYRILLGRYHPDRNKSSRALDIYRAICESMETIERWRSNCRQGDCINA